MMHRAAADADRRNAPVVIGDSTSIQDRTSPRSRTAAWRSRRRNSICCWRWRVDAAASRRASSFCSEWPSGDFEGFDRSIDVHILFAPKKLGDDAKSPRWIETVRGVGSMLKKPETA